MRSLLIDQRSLESTFWWENTFPQAMAPQTRRRGGGGGDTLTWNTVFFRNFKVAFIAIGLSERELHVAISGMVERMLRVPLFTFGFKQALRALSGRLWESVVVSRSRLIAVRIVAVPQSESHRSRRSQGLYRGSQPKK